MLALPSFVVTLSEYVLSLKNHKEILSGLSLSKCITGGEMMTLALKNKIERALGITSFLSTGYTSNESGAVGFPCRLCA